ncbi:MAG: hypothetical protein HOV81_07455 [Kofleriaceae bacterium]|nr:hypothetical protein [Kofleriaceae bacterium]
MRTATQALTVIAEIDPGHRELLDDRLAAIAADLERNPLFRPRDLPDTHFMRFVVVEDRELPALLVWESNHDGDTMPYLDLVASKTPWIDRVFECCVGYPPPRERDYEARAVWLGQHAVRASAFYTGYRGVPRKQVLNDRMVHDAIRNALDDNGNRKALEGLPGHEIQRRLCEHVRVTEPHLNIAGNDSQEARWLLGKIAAIALLIVLFVPLIVVGIPWYLVLRSKEKRDAADVNTRPVHDDKGLAQFEDQDGVKQNQLTHLVDIKPGWFRLATLRFVLAAIDVIARVYSVRGNLGGIVSIHFARWVILVDRSGKQRHRLLFFSNYDGSWESYLGEFVDRAAYGLTAVWSNTVGFPRTERLLGAGARDEEAFKQWTRHHQIRTQVWWTGVPDSTVQNIRDDIWIRQNLDRGLADDEVAAWLRKL